MHGGRTSWEVQNNTEADINLRFLLWDTSHVELGHLAALRFSEVCQLVLLDFLLLALHTQSKVLIRLQLLGSAPVWRPVLFASPALLFLLQPHWQLSTGLVGRKREEPCLVRRGSKA